MMILPEIVRKVTENTGAIDILCNGQMYAISHISQVIQQEKGI
jgi:hypothetical protein